MPTSRKILLKNFAVYKREIARYCSEASIACIGDDKSDPGGRSEKGRSVECFFCETILNQCGKIGVETFLRLYCLLQYDWCYSTRIGFCSRMLCFANTKSYTLTSDLHL